MYGDGKERFSLETERKLSEGSKVGEGQKDFKESDREFRIQNGLMLSGNSPHQQRQQEEGRGKERRERE